MSELKASDFPENISEKFQKLSMSAEQIQNQIISNFEKGLVTEEVFLDGLNVLDKLEKGKKGTVGEIRDWSGKKYQKTATGWVPVKGAGGPAKGGEKEDEPSSLGRLTGQTGTGKKVYENARANSKAYSDFTAQDHLDAAYLHRTVGANFGRMDQRSQEKHLLRGNAHVEQALKLDPKTNKYQSPPSDEKWEKMVANRDSGLKEGSITYPGSQYADKKE